MRISRKLNLAIGGIIVAIIAQTIIGIIHVQSIHKIAQNQIVANKYLAGLVVVQRSSVTMLHVLDDHAQDPAKIAEESEHLLGRINKGVTWLSDLKHPLEQEVPVKAAEKDMLSLIKTISLQVGTLAEKNLDSAGVIDDLEKNLNSLIEASRRSAELNEEFIEQQARLEERFLIYFRLLAFVVSSFIIYVAIVLIFTARGVSFNIDSLITATERIAAGNLSERVEIDSDDELMRLANSFNAMMTIIDTANEQTTQLSRESHERFIQTITAFVKAIEAKDVYTRGHSENVAYYATQVCEAFEWPEEDVENIRVAALLHDIGKIGIKEGVLNKPGKLSDEEFMHIKEHPSISRGILASFPSLEGLANVAVHHHERYDGRGYPDGLEAEEIPYGARILAIADAFDAMISARPYKPPMPLEKALGEIEKNAGTQFDPLLAMVFVDLVRNGKIAINENQQAS